MTAENTDDRIPDIFDQLEIGIILHDPETAEIVDVNDRLESLYGYSVAEFREMDVEEFSAADEGYTQTEAERRIRAAAAGDPQRFEWHVTRADGERLWVRVRLTEATLDGDSFVVAEIRDISELKERERRTRAIFDQTYQFTGLLEPDGTLIEANRTALDFGGLDADDVIGKRVWETDWFTHDESTQQRTREAVEQAATGEFVRMELPVQGTDREAIIDFSIRPVTDETGRVQLLIPEGRDITELKERERQLAETNDLLSRTEALADVGGFELDLQSEALQLTEGSLRILDQPERTELALDEALRYISHRDRSRVTEAIESCLETGDSYDIEVRLITDAGRERWVRTRGELVENDGRPTIRGVLQDITERREREQRLMVLNRVLRHNLRNQLNVVLGCAKNIRSSLERVDAGGRAEPSAELAEGTSAGPTDAERAVEPFADVPLDDIRLQLDHVIESSEELVALAETIQQSERVFEVGQLERSVPVRPLLEELKAEYERQFPEADVEVAGEEGAIRGDGDVLRVALDELVGNALKHAGNDPQVRLEVNRPTPNRVRVSVSDDGPGLPTVERETLSRGEETPLTHGSGLGLWLVNWATTRLDGTLAFEEVERGTTVTLTFPAADQPG